MVTAAHCIVNNPADLGENWEHHTHTPRLLGDSINGTIDDGTNDGCLCHSDVGWIDVDNQASTTPLDTFYASSPTDIRTIRYIPTDSSADQQKGHTICRGAATSGYHCGQIDALTASRTGSSSVDGHDVDQLRRTDFDALPGDSGAVMFFGLDILGIHNDSLDNVGPDDPGGHSWYTTGERIEALGNQICDYSTCT